MKRNIIVLLVTAAILTACSGTTEPEQGTQISGNESCSSENEATINNFGDDLSGNIITESTESLPENTDMEGDDFGSDWHDWYVEPTMQDTLMVRVEGNVSENQAWVDFLKGNLPDYSGVDFGDPRFGELNRPFTLTDMEAYAMYSWEYGETSYVEDFGRFVSIQIFPYDFYGDGEEELLLVCESMSGSIKIWMLEKYQNQWCLVPSIATMLPPANIYSVWLWSDGVVSYWNLMYDDCRDCPDEIIVSTADGEYLELNFTERLYENDEVIISYFILGMEGTHRLFFDYNGEKIDGSPIHEGNLVEVEGYEEDMEAVTQYYYELIGDAVPVREVIGLKGDEEGVMVITREEFYSGAYLD